MLEQAKRPFLLQVDADMILHPQALGMLYRAAVREPWRPWVQGMLWDDLLGRIGNLKLYRMDALKGLRFRNQAGCDRDLETRVVGRSGASVLTLPRLLGYHVATWSPGATWTRFFRSGEKIRLFGEDPGRTWHALQKREADAQLRPWARLALAALGHGMGASPRRTEKRGLGETETPGEGLSILAPGRNWFSASLCQQQSSLFHERAWSGLEKKWGTLWQKACAEGRVNPLERYQRASWLANCGRFPEAVLLFQTLVELEGCDRDLRAKACFHLGRMALLEKRSEQALVWLVKTLRMMPDHQEAARLLQTLEQKR